MSLAIERPSICLVLGGKGFIGSHLVDALLQHGHKVRLYDRPHQVSLHASVQPTASLEVMEGDFTDEADIGAALANVDVCFHLVSTTLPQSSNADPLFDIETNLTATVRLLNLAVVRRVKKIVFISSGGTVYGKPLYLPIDERHPTNPTCSYGITKLAIEKYLELFNQLHGLDYTVLRVSNAFGERQRTQASQGVVAVFLNKALRGETVEIWGDGSVVRDYIHVSDIVAALLAAMPYSGAERVFNIGSGEGISLNSVLASIEQVTGRTTLRKYTPGRPFDVPASVLATDRAVQMLSWRPRTSFLQGLERMASFLESQENRARAFIDARPR